MDRIPASIAQALLVGVLVRFTLDAAQSVAADPLLVLSMLAAFLAGRRWWPRYAVPGVLLVGVAVAALGGRLALGQVAWQWSAPVWVQPVFDLGAIIGLGLPLFIVTMASQNLPGVAAQRAAGYDTPVSPVVGATGLLGLLLAPFGAFAINLAAITAALCMSPEAHPDPGRRYWAAAAAGGFYLLTGLAGAAVVALFAALPRPLVVTVAGLALLGTVAAGLHAALKDEGRRDAAVLTFVVTLSGVSLLGIGSAFWGVVAGASALLLRPR
jgi:benzoate membrane transport protein